MALQAPKASGPNRINEGPSRASVAWWHEFRDGPYQVGAALQGYGSAPLAVDGLAPPSGCLALGAGLNAQMHERPQASLGPGFSL